MARVSWESSRARGAWGWDRVRCALQRGFGWHARGERDALAGATDHITLPVSHMGMLLSARVATEVGGFLEKGRFSLGDASSHRATR